MTQEKQGAEIHPLVEKEISFIQNWQEWKELWKVTKQADLLHSLLHCGFSVRVDDWVELVQRVLWYLNIADKHRASSWEFQKNRYDEDRIFPQIFMGGKEINSFTDLRFLLAKKAFQSLCQNFFKNTNNEDRLPSWVGIATRHDVLEKLFWFFRLDNDGHFINLGYSNDHNEAIAREFIRNLCNFAWDCENFNRWFGAQKIDEEIKETFRKARPNMITLLFGLKQLDILLKSKYELDEKCMKRLEELAMNFHLWLPETASLKEHRKPESISEACLGSSQAACVLLVLRVKQAVKKRLEKICELEEQRRETEEKLKAARKS